MGVDPGAHRGAADGQFADARQGRFDALDARLLLALDEDPFATVVALAQRLGVARNTVQTRLRRLGAAPGWLEAPRA